MSSRSPEPTVIDADDFAAAQRDPRTHAFWAQVDEATERYISPSPGCEIMCPEELWRQVCDVYGREATKRWFAAPNELLNGLTPASQVRERPDDVAAAGRALVDSHGAE